MKKPYLISLNRIDEADGSLVAINSGLEIPFEIKRVFYIFNNPREAIRGRHANKCTDFVMIPVHGSLKIRLDQVDESWEYQLHDASKGIFVPMNTWMEVSDFDGESVLLVLASTEYEPGQYYENREEYEQEDC